MALDVMDNQSFLEKLKFSIDDIGLHYYLYNWMCPKMKPDKVVKLHPIPFIVVCCVLIMLCVHDLI